MSSEGLTKAVKNLLSELNDNQVGHGKVDNVLAAIQFGDGHVHVNYPGNFEVTRQILSVLKNELDKKGLLGLFGLKEPTIIKKEILTESKPDEYKKDRKIVFKHSRALGDGLMMTAGLRDFHLLFPDIKVNVESNQPSLWENNPYIDTSIKKEDPGVEFYKVGYPMVGNVNNSNMHFTSMFLFDMIAAADLHEALPLRIGEFCAAFANGSVGDPSMGDTVKNPDAKEPFISLRNKYSDFCKNFMRQRGDVYLSEKEKTYNMIKDVYGIEKYWVVAPGGKRDCTTKIWDWRRFQTVIDYFDGLIKFVVIGRSDHLVEKLNNVIDLTDKFNEEVRGLIPLVYHSEGCVSGLSFLMHMAAAIPPKKGKARKPCVVLAGGREPSGWTAYTNHRHLHTNGALECCDNGGCWQARVIPIAKDPDHNKRLCHKTITDNGRTVAKCMDMISAQDVIRAIEMYYDGGVCEYEKKNVHTIKTIDADSLAKFIKKEIVTSEIDTNILNEVTVSNYVIEDSKNQKEINLVGNLNSAGGGEQSFLMISKILEKSGWKINLYPWGVIHANYLNNGNNIIDASFKSGAMVQQMKEGLPLLFYANDCIWDFCKEGQELVNKSSSVIIGVNFANGILPKCRWLDQTGKLKAVIFQNEEKKDEFDRDVLGFENTKRIVLFGAIDLDKFYQVCTADRKDSKGELVVLRHSTSDWRKFVTQESVGNGDKIHIWQKHIIKELDTKFYERLLKDTKNIRFEFMPVHSEIEKHFRNEKRMVFHKWNSMPVEEFLSRGHIYLYRTSNMWRDQYPRVVAEALASGLPILSEPRDGTKDRIVHGDTGFYCVDYDSFLLYLKLLQRKEGYRKAIGLNAKEWSRKNLDPCKWGEILDVVLAN